MKGLVIYESRYGATERYANWIGEALQYEVVPVKQVKSLSEYENIVIGSWIMAGKPKITNWVMKNWGKFVGKNIIFYTSSGAPGNHPDLMKYYINAFPEEIRSKMIYFPLNGKQKISQMNWLDRKMMGIAINMTRKKDPQTAEKMKEDFDHVNEDDIKPLVEYINRLNIKTGREIVK